MGGADGMAAAIAQPALAVEIEVEIFRDANSCGFVGGHAVPPKCLPACRSASTQLGVAVAIHFKSPAFRNEVSAVGALQHSTTFDTIAGLQRFPRVDLRPARSAADRNSTRALESVRCVWFRCRHRRKPRLRYRLPNLQANQVDTEVLARRCR